MIHNLKINDAPKVNNKIIRAKSFINSPGDIYEQEADAMAYRVMRMSSQEFEKPVTGLIGKSLQRKCAHCEEEEKKKKPIMRKSEAGNSGISVSSSFAASLNSSKGGGSPLPQGTKSFMENAFSTDFSAVKIHTDVQASELSKSINAKAFTYGNDIYFGDGQYNLGSVDGKYLLAHELTHTLQQNIDSGLLQRIQDGRATGWKRWYEFVQQAANNFYEKELNIDMSLQENRANIVHSCKHENNWNQCKTENYSNNSNSPQVTVSWRPENKEVTVINLPHFCRYTYVHDSGGYIFTKLNCETLAVYT
ncbi:MAG: DUF4157 domain-containing protein [Chitinophagales bacterium]|nr:DUF4157 domain-containing protein [Chitinophagales bacterium]MBP8753281.1 DUF4157 domain-containing protein [Chitinophagales bacterium]MBP9188389.1 DUF4157 domain-containing protein [Chitinophagales bacterium]MBP9703445.1 DUF4157 domain-containing protein [Chitinophagales bacterium]